jgi:hypothetical protein
MGAIDKIEDKAAEKIAQHVVSNPMAGPATTAAGDLAAPPPAGPPSGGKGRFGTVPPKAAAPILPANNLSAVDAGTLGLSGGDVAVDPGQLEKTGHVVPGQPTETPPEVPAAPAPEPVAPEIQSVGPVVASAAPTTKEMLAKILNTTETPPNAPEKKGEGIDWVGMLKGAGSGLGDFLQRWGLGLQGKGDSPTKGDTERAREFELAKQQKDSELMQARMKLDNQYQNDRMSIMQEYNVANMTQQQKAARDQMLAENAKEYENAINLLPAQIAAQRANIQFQNQITANSPNTAVSTVLKGR